MIFQNRRDAGRQLARELLRCRPEDPLVLGLPRGGIPVAYEVALALDAPLDVLVVRKLGMPYQPELAFGAIASGDIRVLNDELAGALDAELIEDIVARESAELLRRERRYRGDRPFPELSGKDIVLVDDGLATGATMRAAVEAVQSRGPAGTTIAVPTGSRRTVEALAPLVDRVICLDVPAYFYAVGQSYLEFGQTTDDEVMKLLGRAALRPGVIRKDGEDGPARTRSGAPPSP